MTASPPYIAILDDHKSVGKSLTRLLRMRQIYARAFTSSKEFFEAVRQRAPECVLLDVQMPEMSGLEVQEQLLNEGHRVPIIFITANDEAPIRTQALARGALGFIAKPCQERVLLDLLATARGATKPSGLGLRLQPPGKPALARSGLPAPVFDFELTDLLPCPFCGAYPRLTKGNWVDDDAREHYWARVTCPRCDASVGTRKDAQFLNLKSAMEMAVGQWHHRVPSVPPA
jgi:CheY-like chemotaxis protein